MNMFIIFDARLVADPEVIGLKDSKSLTKIRVADNPMGKKDDKRPARFVSCKAFGVQGSMMARLTKGDLITVSGSLEVEAFTAKDGTARTADVMTVSSFKVQKSESFFGAEKAPDKGESLDDLFGAP